MQKAVFLDRDGTINIEKNYLYCIKDFEYIIGVLEALHILQELGYMLIIVTNQSGIARGYYREQDFLKLNEWMLSDLNDRGIHITKVYYCPHHPNGRIEKFTMKCNCRKPKTGLFWQAERELGVDMNRSFAIGDRIRDLSICFESGVQGILLGDKERIENSVSTKGTMWFCKDLLQAANCIQEKECSG